MTSSEQLTGRTLGDFVVRHRIGEGGFGEVYRAEQPALGREAVIKVLHNRHRSSKTVIQRFLREARLASKLDHPYAAHIYAFGVETDGLMWIAMEYVKGQTLHELLRQRGSIPLEMMVPLLDRICEVLQAAHDLGIVHRDIKPPNVMVVQRSGRVFPKLLDFGIAKLSADQLGSTIPPPPVAALPLASHTMTVPDSTANISIEGAPVDPTISFVGAPGGAIAGAMAGRSRRPSDGLAPTQQVSGANQSDDVVLTEAGAAVGSPPYMAPEQWDNSAAATARTDLYALGVSTYEAITGRRPFVEASLPALAFAHATTPIPPLGPALPPALDDVMAKVLAKRSDDRYGSVMEFAQAFRVAAGFASQQPLPAIDDDLRVSIETTFPQPIAEAVAAFHAAHNPHQGRDALRDIVTTAIRYVALVALAAHSQVRVDDPGNAASVAEMLRELRRRSFVNHEWAQLARELVTPFQGQAKGHPIPELVSLLHADFATEVMAERSDPDALAVVRELLPGVTRLLRSLTFLADYPLVVVQDGRAESWMGVRRPRRIVLEHQVRDDDHGRPLLLDAAGRPVVSLWPVIQISSPMADKPAELFLLEGRGRRGAKLTALPQPLEKQDERLWEWLAEHFAGHDSEERSISSANARPYRGLQSFTREDADTFIGRAREVDAAVNRLRTSSLIAVVGPSGAGKSSFVHAGVVPSLPETWEMITVRPGTTPIAALIAGLRRAGLGVDRLGEAMRKSPTALGDLFQARKVTTVLVIDQFEELFTLGAPLEEQRIYVRALLGATQSADDRVRVILTLRDDFLARATQLPELRERLPGSLFLLGTPARGELVRMLTQPLYPLGFEFDDPQLVESMVDEVAETPGALALLSFTAQKLWELRDRHFRQLTRRAYESLGGVVGALARHAEATLTEMMANEQRLARIALGHLVTADGTRAILSRSELEQLLRDPQAPSMIEKLIAARLLTATETEDGEDSIELVHEALVVAWPRLGEWRREDAEGARLRDEVRSAARQWVDRGKPRGMLWRDDALAELKVWHTRHPTTLTDAEAAFVQACVDDARRVTFVRRAAIVGIAGIVVLAVVAIYVGVRFNVRAATRRAVALELAEGDRLVTQARATDVQVEASRKRAFAAFDAQAKDTGEASWAEVLDASTREDEMYRDAAQHIEAAIMRDPTNAAVRAALADVLLARALAADRDGKPGERDELRARLRLYDDGTRQRWLETPAHLSVKIDPVDLDVTIARASTSLTGARPWIDQHPLTSQTELPAGSYLLVGHAPGRAEVRLPVTLGRDESRSLSLAAPLANAVPSGFVYIPSGRFLFGSSRDESRRKEFLNTTPLHARETGSFLIAIHETTWGEWIEFLRALTPEARIRRIPRTANPATTGAVVLRVLPEDRWELEIQPTTTPYRVRSGDRLHYEGRAHRADQEWLRLPVSAISADDAVAYTQWLDQSGKVPHARLCTEAEWERATRGADDRELPSGDRLAADDANFDLTYGRQPAAFGPDEVGAHPASRSPFGIDDAAGNVWEWTTSVLEPHAYVARGGAYYYGEMTCLAVNRQVVEPTLRDITVGLRVCADIRP